MSHVSKCDGEWFGKGFTTVGSFERHNYILICHSMKSRLKKLMISHFVVSKFNLKPCQLDGIPASLHFNIYLINCTCAFPDCGVKMSPMSIPDSPRVSSFLKAYLRHSGSQTAAPRHTCRSWSGRAAGLQSGTCCGMRQ